MLADNWWFWALTGALLAAAVLWSGRYRALAARIRAVALERRLVEPGAGGRIDTRPGGFWSDLSWLSLLLGAWVAASPWIWGYDDVAGAVAADLVTGGAVMVLTLLGIVFPPLNALTVVAGTWLVLSPWVVGYGDEGGPVGLSDTIAGVLIARARAGRFDGRRKPDRAGGEMPIGRVQRSRDDS